jgi:hypothetical protein
MGEESLEKALGNILRFGGVLAEAPDASIDRIPICGAEPFERLLGSVRFDIPCGQNDAPVSGGKGLAFEGNAWRIRIFAAGDHAGSLCRHVAF